MHLVPIFCTVAIVFQIVHAHTLQRTEGAEVYSRFQPRFNWDKTRYFYAFGDSYTFVQGTQGHANFSFIGDAFDVAYSPRQILNNEIIPKNTSSDGSNWAEYLTGCFEGLPSNCDPHQLWDFAFAGADIDSSLLPLHHNFSVDLVDQVKHWATYVADVVPHPADETLIAWWIGINDTGDTADNETITDWEAFWETEMHSLFGAVENAYDHDLRGTYLFVNVPPEERTPAWINAGARASTYRQHILDYNVILAAYVARFAAAHEDVKVLTFDAHIWFNGILDDAAQYGFLNITGYCECIDDTYFWYNTGHPTEHVHKLLAQAIKEDLKKASA